MAIIWVFSPSYDLNSRYENLCRRERDLIMHQITKEYKNIPLEKCQIPFHDFCSEHRLWERYCLVTNRLKQSLVDSNRY